VISTLRPEFFNQHIQRALHERKEKDALNRGLLKKEIEELKI